ncbi:hypothetical protein [Burkholderia cepacia]|nr:hypothetical protein [Burkholderia cepacia]
MNQVNSWQRVMYDPVAYINPKRFRVDLTSTVPSVRAAVNDLLITQFDLPLDATPPKPGTNGSLLVRHWRCWPTISWLLGCHASRGALLRGGRILRLPLWVRQFAMASGQQNEYVPEPNIPLETEVLLARGLHQLIDSAGPLANALGMRFRLALSPDIDLYMTPMAPKSIDPTFFRKTIQYAARHTNQAIGFSA